MDPVDMFVAAADQLWQDAHDLHMEKWEKIDNGEVPEHQISSFKAMYEDAATSLQLRSLKMQRKAIDILESRRI